MREMLGNNGAERAFRTLGFVQCKHNGFREARANVKVFYQKHPALFILTILLYRKHVGCFFSLPPPPLPTTQLPGRLHLRGQAGAPLALAQPIHQQHSQSAHHRLLLNS